MASAVCQLVEQRLREPFASMSRRGQFNGQRTPYFVPQRNNSLAWACLVFAYWQEKDSRVAVATGITAVILAPGNYLLRWQDRRNSTQQLLVVVKQLGEVKIGSSSERYALLHLKSEKYYRKIDS